MPRLPDHEVIASLQAQVSTLRIQLRNAEALIPADVKEYLTTEIKETADAVIQDFEAIRSERDRYRSALAEMSEELSHYPEGDGIFGHLKRVLRRALTKTTNPAISIQTGI